MQLKWHVGAICRADALCRYPGLRRGAPITPRVRRLISWQVISSQIVLYKSHIVPNEGRIVRAAPLTGGSGASEGWPLATVALQHDTLRTPPIDRTERHFLGLVASCDASDNPSHCFLLLDRRHQFSHERPKLTAWARYRTSAERRKTGKVSRRIFGHSAIRATEQASSKD